MVGQRATGSPDRYATGSSAVLPVTIRRVLLAQHRVDFRKGPDGLLAEAYRLGAEPYDGAEKARFIVPTARTGA